MSALNVDEPGQAAWWIAFVNRVPRYKFLLRKRWWILALTTSCGLLAAAWYLFSQPLLYISSARLVVGGKMSVVENASYNELLSDFLGTQIEWIRSGEVRRRAEERLQGMFPGIQDTPVKLEAAVIPHTAIFMLRATSWNGDYAQKFLTACVEEYIQARKEMRSEKSETMLDTLTDQLARFEKEVRESEEELLNFQKRNNVASLQEASNSTGAYIVKLNEQLADLKKEYQLLNLLNLDQNLERKQAMKPDKDTTGGAPATADTVVTPTAAENDYLRAKQAIEVLKAKRADLARVLRPHHPDMIQLTQEIATQETLLGTFRTQTLDQLKTRRESIGLQVRNLESTVQEWETKALDLNEKVAEYNRIKSKGERAKASYDSILASSRSVDISKSIDQEMVSIMDPASAPVPSRPGVVTIILCGIAGGALLGLTILFGLDKIDDRMNSFGEFQSFFTEDVLARIPSEPKLDDPISLCSGHEQSAFVESMRALRSSLYYLPVTGMPPKTLLITSAVPDEGKSTVAVSLAITMSYAGAKVLLVDGDLRRGSIHETFGLDNSLGLGDVLKDSVAVEKAIRPTKVENLHLISRGANLRHPGESFLSTRTDELLKAVYPNFDYVIFDSSPVLVADDTTSLAPKIDATIFVVRFSYSSARRSQEAIEFLKRRQVNLIGMVCNGVDQSMHDYYYNKYPEYYSVKQVSET